MASKNSLSLSQKAATVPYPEPHKSSPCPPFPTLEDPFWYYYCIYAWVFQGFLPSCLPTKTLYTTVLSTTRHTRPAQLIFGDLITQKKNERGEQINKLLIMYFSPLPCNLVHHSHSLLLPLIRRYGEQSQRTQFKYINPLTIPLRPNYTPQHSTLKHPQPAFLP